MFENAPFDSDGFTLTDRWYCKETSTWYPVGTSRYEIEHDLNDDDNMYVVVQSDDDGDFTSSTTAKLFMSHKQAHKYVEHQVICKVVSYGYERSELVLNNSATDEAYVDVCDKEGYCHAVIQSSFAYMEDSYNEWVILKIDNNRN